MSIADAYGDPALLIRQKLHLSQNLKGDPAGSRPVSVVFPPDVYGKEAWNTMGLHIACEPAVFVFSINISGPRFPVERISVLLWNTQGILHCLYGGFLKSECIVIEISKQSDLLNG